MPKSKKVNLIKKKTKKRQNELNKFIHKKFKK